MQPISRFGLLDLDADGRVKRFAEKPQAEGWINAGFFVFNRRVFDYLDGGDACVMEREPLERLAADGPDGRLSPRGFLLRHGHLSRIRSFERMWESGQAPWKVW